MESGTLQSGRCLNFGDVRFSLGRSDYVGITSESPTFWDIIFVHGLLCSGRLELRDLLGLTRRGTFRFWFGT